MCITIMDDDFDSNLFEEGRIIFLFITEHFLNLSSYFSAGDQSHNFESVLLLRSISMIFIDSDN